MTLEELKQIDGSPKPNGNVILSKPMRATGSSMKEPAVEMTEIEVPGTDNDNHHFKLKEFSPTEPDSHGKEKGAIEVDASKDEGQARLKIVAEGIFEEDPGILGTMAQVAIAEAGADSAVVEATNLSSDFLQRAGGQVIRAAGDPSQQQIRFFPSDQPINQRRIA